MSLSMHLKQAPSRNGLFPQKITSKSDRNSVKSIPRARPQEEEEEEEATNPPRVPARNPYIPSMDSNLMIVAAKPTSEPKEAKEPPEEKESKQPAPSEPAKKESAAPPEPAKPPPKPKPVEKPPPSTPAPTPGAREERRVSPPFPYIRTNRG
jgi:hypothetical protein